MAGPRPLPIQSETPQGLTLSLPLVHFAAVAAWLGPAAAGLVVVAPDLAVGNVFAPRAFAATHLFTLGVVATAIFAALHQFVPAVLGVPIRSPRVAWAGFLMLVPAIALLVAGFWGWNPALQGAGWLLFFGAVGCSSWNILPARRRASRNRIVGLYITLSHSWLGVAMVIAVVRIGSALGWWPSDRAGLVAAHFHIGALGFATLTVVGIGSLMIPGFLGSKGHPAWPLRWIGWVDSVGLALFSIGEAFGVRPLVAPGAILLLAGVALHLGIVVSYYRSGGPRRLDPGLAFIATAFGFLLAAALVAAWLLFRGTGPGRGWAAYAILALPGWLTLIVMGVMHRVVPRLVAQRIAARRASRTVAEGRAELLNERLAWVSLGLMAAGAAGLAAAVGAGAREGATAAAGLYAAGVATVLVQAFRLVRFARA